MKRWLCILCVVLLVCTGCGRMEIDISYDYPDTDELVREASLIVLGRITEKKAGHYRFKNDTEKPDGESNLWVTPHTLRVTQVYKGDLRPDVKEISVGTLNYYSPATMKTQNIRVDFFELKVGEPYLFLLEYSGIDNCYIPVSIHQGWLSRTKDPDVYTTGNVVLKLSELPARLQRLEQEIIACE